MNRTQGRRKRLGVLGGNEINLNEEKGQRSWKILLKSKGILGKTI